MLYLPLRSRRLDFSELRCREGDRVEGGQAVALDPVCGVPLLAPRGGVVRLGQAEGHVVLEDLSDAPPRGHESVGREELPGPHPEKRRCIIDLGAWPFLEVARTGAVPAPQSTPGAILVRTARLEPYLARGSVLLADRMDAFVRGLEHLQSLLEYQPMYLVAPEVDTALAQELRERTRGHAWLHVVTIPLVYPMDDVALAARRLRLERPTWAIGTEGVLAVEAAIERGEPATERVIAIGGPAALDPRHLKLVPGYPLASLREAELEAGSDARLVAGGVLTGAAVDGGARGLDVECAGLVAIPRPEETFLFGWIRPGLSFQSYGRTFLSVLRPRFPERLTTAQRGERRACIACGQCESVCPSRLLPHVIHRRLYAGGIDEAERLGVELCIGCGLCSYVCPSKLELRQAFLETRQLLAEERREMARESARAAEAAGEATA